MLFETADRGPTRSIVGPRCNRENVKAPRSFKFSEPVMARVISATDFWRLSVRDVFSTEEKRKDYLAVNEKPKVPFSCITPGKPQYHYVLLSSLKSVQIFSSGSSIFQTECLTGLMDLFCCFAGVADQGCVDRLVLTRKERPLCFWL